MNTSTINILKGLGAGLGSIIAICTSLWFFGEPFLEDYVDSKIELYEKARIEASSSKVKLRKLHADEMGIPVDRVHIVEGAMYDQYTKLKNLIPLMETYFSKNIPYMYIREDGKEVYVYNGQSYEIHRDDNGYALHFRNGKWRPVP